MREPQLSRELRVGAAEIEDRRLTMQAAGEVRLTVTTDRCRPLSEAQPVCQIAFGGEGFSASAKLTDRDVDALIDCLEAIRDGEVWEDD